MITLWLHRWTLSIYVAEPAYDAFDGYDSYIDPGVGLAWTWRW